ncbi:MAG: 4-hydroxy-tetrahydrodipicolinate synthase [Bryobacteraceae bacterium]
MRLQGCGTALVTPFQPDLTLDEEAVRRLARRQIEAGVHFLVPCGTTGESPTLEHEERLRVVEIVLEEAHGKLPVLAGAGGYHTGEVVALAREFEAMGADGILSVTPYYNKPSQEGLYQHYLAIANAVKLPIVVYNVPSRTGVNVEPATLRRLAGIENIVAVKEASGNVAQMANLCATLPPDFTVLSGDDAITLALAGLGGKGIISVASNEIPAPMAALAQACVDGRFDDARALQRKWLPLMEVNFVESNPIPVKWALARMGLLQPVWRLPLVPPSPASRERIDAVLRECGLAVS